jgi:Rrf2 family protein
MLSNTHFSMAVHVLSALAYNPDQVVGSEDLARTVGTNPSFLRGLIGQLKAAGLVETHLGKGGGATLARSPSKITLADVYRATESRSAVKTHACDSRSPCPVARNMERLLADVNRRVEKVVGDELKRMTVADLVASFVGRPV